MKLLDIFNKGPRLYNGGVSMTALDISKECLLGVFKEIWDIFSHIRADKTHILSQNRDAFLIITKYFCASALLLKINVQM